MATAMEPRLLHGSDGIESGGGGSGLAVVGLDDASDDIALDDLALLLGGFPERGSGKAVEIAHGTGSGLVEEADSVGGEQFAIATGLAEAQAQVLGGVVGDEGLDLEAVMDPRIERAIAPQGEAIAQFRKTDEDDREQRATVPLVVQQNV
jgi:hypothetical protein